MPICKKCNVEKSVEAFAPEKRSKTGHTATCKECYNLGRKTKYNEDPLVKKAKLDYKKEHREENIEYQREYYAKNKEVLTEKRKSKVAPKVGE